MALLDLLSVSRTSLKTKLSAVVVFVACRVILDLRQHRECRESIVRSSRLKQQASSTRAHRHTVLMITRHAQLNSMWSALLGF